MVPQTKAAALQSPAKTPPGVTVRPAPPKTVLAKAVIAKTVPAKTKAAVSVSRAPGTNLAALSQPTTIEAPKPAAVAQGKEEAAATSGAGGFVLQIGSFKSDAEANASWQTYKGAHSSVASYSSDVRKVELGAKGTWYRLRIGPFANLSEANAACVKLKAQGGNCFPAKQ
jgi:cell division protein FtsN